MGCVQSKPTARRKGLISQQNDKVANNNVQVRREQREQYHNVHCGCWLSSLTVSCLSKKNFELNY